MTIDVEDYFHVSVFDGIVPRISGKVSRAACARTRSVSWSSSRAMRSGGRFSSSAWVAERFPQLVQQIADAGHEIASHGYGHRLVYDQTPKAFRDDVRRRKHSRIRGRQAGARVQSAKLFHNATIAVGTGYSY